jgi:hypothetical protein
VTHTSISGCVDDAPLGELRRFVVAVDNRGGRASELAAKSFQIFFQTSPSKIWRSIVKGNNHMKTKMNDGYRLKQEATASSYLMSMSGPSRFLPDSDLLFH